MRVKNVTVDEITYIAAGYYHLRTGDFEYNATNPALMKMVAAAPLLWADLELPTLEGDPSDWDAIEEWVYARQFLYENRCDADRILFAARLPFVAIGTLLGFFVFAWAARLYGAAGGLLALFLFAFSPNLLAHTRLATQDIGLTTVCFVASYAFWCYCENPRARVLVLAGALLGLAAATKTTAAIILPAWGLYWAVSAFRDESFGVDCGLPFVRRTVDRNVRAGQLLSGSLAAAALAGVALATLNAAYAFSGSFVGLGEVLSGDRLARALPVPLANLAGEFPSPFPKAFAQGLLFQTRLGARSGGMFFNGQIYPELWYLMGVSLLIKTPIPAVLCAVGACTAAIANRLRDGAELLLVAIVLAFLTVFTVWSNIGGGIRYVLPIFPCLFVLIGRFARVDTHWSGFRIAALLVLGAWYVASSLSIHPHYLAYFNEVVGGPRNGYKILADANIDWGQDLKLLKAYMDERGIGTIKLAYFGSADASYYGIDYEYLPSVGLAPKKDDQYWWYELDSDEKRRLEPQRGTIAVSATLLSRPQWMGPLFRGTYDWLADHEPVDQVGYSILIYEIP